MGWLDLVFPASCVGCGSWGGYICPDCLNKVGSIDIPICPECGKPSVYGKTHHRCKRVWGMDGLVAALPYRGLVKHLLGKYKYRLVKQLTDELVELVFSYGDLTPLQDRNWMVLAVPLHKKRRRWRGYNQAYELAKGIAKRGDWQLVKEGVLERSVYSKPQTSFSGKERRQNVSGAFILGDITKELTKQPILLVDDVWTTGASMRECTKVLKRNGVKEVWGLVVARTV